MLKAKFACKRASALALKRSPSDTVRVFVGEESREFVFSRIVLTSTSTYFEGRLDASGVAFCQRDAQLNTLWMEDICPDMFQLFAFWLDHQGSDFQRHVDEADASDCCEELHWDLINLHLFAARIGLDALQDAAMDAVQDMYLRRDWDITPRFVARIYTEAEPVASYRLRKWIVAMAAWTLGGDECVQKLGTAEAMEALFRDCPQFWADYVAHIAKTDRSRVQLQFKNPQLRLPSNSLRNEERQFGFRQCSFHTHRSAVGQGRCPHERAATSQHRDHDHRLPYHQQGPVKQQQLQPALLKMIPILPDSPVSDEDSDLEFGSITGRALVASPRTAIFDLYLDIN